MKPGGAVNSSGPNLAANGLGDVSGQSLLFGDGGEIFRSRRFLVENVVGEYIRLLARGHQRLLVDHGGADLGFGVSGSFRVGKSTGAILR